MNSFDYLKPPLPKKDELPNNEFADEIKKIWDKENLIEQINGVWSKHIISLNKNDIFTLKDLINHKGDVDEINKNTLDKYKLLASALDESKQGDISVEIEEEEDKS